MRRTALALAIGGLLLAGCLGGGEPPPTPEATPTAAPTATPEATSTVTPTATAKSLLTTFGDGHYRVGRHPHWPVIAPGRYNAITTDSCQWWVLQKHTSYQADSKAVRIEPTDIGFMSSGCGAWEPHLAQSGPARYRWPFGDGVYVVGGDHFIGAEVAPGLYRATAPTESCGSSRLLDLTEEYGWVEWIDEGWARWTAWSGFPVVEIEETDAGFFSEGCGEWSDQLTPIVAPGQPFGDGVYVVGVDIAPGRYRTASATDECEWRRLGTFAKPRRSLGKDDGPLAEIAEIAPSDAGFVSSGCGAWSPLAPIAEPGQPFGDGAFVVGAEVAPGRYRSDTATDECQWRHVPDFGGAYRMYPEHPGYTPPHHYDTLPIVEIRADDAGFYSEGCGEWEPAERITASRTTFGDGEYFPGLDVEPGYYRTASPVDEDCVWGRPTLRGWVRGTKTPPPYGYGGSRGGKRPLAHIEDTRGGFVSSGCGTWEPWTQAVLPGQPFGDGTYRVGPEIEPGRYRATSPTADCRWVRRSDFLGIGGYESTRQIAVGSTAFADIGESDAGFTASGCGVWSNDATPLIPPGQPFGDGAWFVGSEVAPGRYRADAPSDECWWLRLSDFEGGNGFSYPPGYAGYGDGTSAFVDIEESDAGFHTLGCGEWTPVAP